jgi:methylglutaconyl-CoA hydratase
MIKLGDIAYARSGDKGANSNIGVIANDEESYQFLVQNLTKERVNAFFSHLGVTRTERFELPNLLALNFILYNALEKGGSLSLRLDAQGKTLGQKLLQMPLEVNKGVAPVEYKFIAVTNLQPNISIITLNRPEKRNALSLALLEEFYRCLETLEANKEIQSLIITGTDPAFCSGLDLSEASKPEMIKPSSELLAKIFSGLYNSRLITMAAVNGPALAGGAGIVCACNFAFAAESAQFGFPEVRRGLVAAQVTALLKRLMSQRAMLELILLAQPISSETALQMGLINRITPANKLIDQSKEFINEILTSPIESIVATKKLLRQLESPSLTEDLNKAISFHREARDSIEARKGIASFLEEKTK